MKEGFDHGKVCSFFNHQFQDAEDRNLNDSALKNTFRLETCFFVIV